MLYGYWTLLIGTFLEGETILMLGGLSAKLGLLDLRLVMLTAFIGSVSGDQLYFHIGRFKGKELVPRHPKWKRRIDRVHRMIERYHDLIMLGFRFVYGIRILTPFVIGMNRKNSAVRFSILNAIGGMIWSMTVSAGGYFFGYALEIILNDIKKFELYIIIGVAVFGTALWFFHKIREAKSSTD